MLYFDNISYWEKETYINHTDLLVVGAGIVGLSTAIHYKERFPSKNVTVIERGYLPTGVSSKNAGFACIGSPSELLADLKSSSEEEVFATVKKRWDGLNYLRQLLGDKAIHFEELGSYELFSSTEKEKFEACLDNLSFLNQQLAPVTHLPKTFEKDDLICSKNGFKGFTHAIRHHAEGQLNTGKMIAALVRLAHEKGVILLNGIEALAIEALSLATNYGTIQFEQVAVCTNGFAKQLLPTEDVNPARAQVIITKPIENLSLKGIYHFDEGFYYFRNIENRVLFGGGRNINFATEQTMQLENTAEIIDRLTDILRNQILPTTNLEIDYAWAGTMGVGMKKSPIIKAIQPHVYCGVRLGGMGVAIGTLVGKELAELIIAST